MNNLLDFLKKISEKLGIETCDKEKHNPNTYSMRIIYSAIGHVALASLFDLNDENEPISVTHFIMLCLHILTKKLHLMNNGDTM